MPASEPEPRSGSNGKTRPLAANARVGYASRRRAVRAADIRQGEETERMTADISNSGVAAEELRQFIERIETLEEEKRVVSEQVKDVYAEAKGRGFDTKAMRQIVRIRAKKPEDREEEEAMLELYKSALGMA
jgi:uncharacterized protein (UPF0335 family)